MTQPAHPLLPDWQNRAQQGLPPPTAVLERNVAITAVYARLYLEHPAIFKWAGMAAFASHRVGMALVPYAFETVDEEVTGIADAHGHPSGKEGLFQDLNLIRTVNNNIYNDIAWAH